MRTNSRAALNFCGVCPMRETCTALRGGPECGPKGMGGVTVRDARVEL